MMSSTPSESRTDSEKKKFRNAAGDIVVATQLYGETAAGAVIPFLVADDGSSRGKVVTVVE